MRRNRDLLSSPASGPGSCAALEEFHTCNTQSCTTECTVSDWADWTTCSLSCATGTQTRERKMISAGVLKDGASCTDSIEMEQSQNCNTQVCPADTDCKLTTWGEWTTCTATCGGASQIRKRSVVEPQSGKGDGCEAVEESQNCNVFACDTDCVIGDWDAWQPCEAVSKDQCVKRRERHPKTQTQGNGTACPVLTDVQNCDKDANCVTSWKSEGNVWGLNIVIIAGCLGCAYCIWKQWHDKHLEKPLKENGHVKRSRGVNLGPPAANYVQDSTELTQQLESKPLLDSTKGVDLETASLGSQGLVPGLTPPSLFSGGADGHQTFPPQGAGYPGQITYAPQVVQPMTQRVSVSPYFR